MLEDDICLRGKIAIPIKTSQFRDVHYMSAQQTVNIPGSKGARKGIWRNPAGNEYSSNIITL
jgi:hypothetical protein